MLHFPLVPLPFQTPSKNQFSMFAVCSGFACTEGWRSLFVLLDEHVHRSCFFQYRKHLLGSRDPEGVFLLRKPSPSVCKGRVEMSATLLLQLLFLLCTHLRTRADMSSSSGRSSIECPGSYVIEVDCLPWMDFLNCSAIHVTCKKFSGLPTRA